MSKPSSRGLKNPNRTIPTESYVTSSDPRQRVRDAILYCINAIECATVTLARPLELVEWGLIFASLTKVQGDAAGPVSGLLSSVLNSVQSFISAKATMTIGQSAQIVKLLRDALSQMQHVDVSVHVSGHADNCRCTGCKTETMWIVFEQSGKRPIHSASVPTSLDVAHFEQVLKRLEKVARGGFSVNDRLRVEALMKVIDAAREFNKFCEGHFVTRDPE